MDNIWILFALIASVSNALRDLYIKRKIKADSILVVASTRMIAFGFLLVLTPFFLEQISFVGNQILFIFLLFVTVVLTFIATTLKINIIQKEEISLSSPLLSMTPIFIIPWAMIILKESISFNAFIGIVLAVIGALIVLGLQLSTLKKIRISYITNILIILMIYGLTTVIDKVEIGMIGGFLYSLVWTGSSALAGLIILRKYQLREYITNTVSLPNIVQSVFWAVSFLFQQLAIQYSFSISMNTAYIKSIMYISIIINIVVGGKIFKETNLVRKFIGTIILLIGNSIIVFGV